jgi:hypothetical protein
MKTSSPSWYWRDVGMKMPPPLRNGMYAAYSAARSRMLSESTPGRAPAGRHRGARHGTDRFVFRHGQNNAR